MTTYTIDEQIYWDIDGIVDYAASLGRPMKRVTARWYCDTGAILADMHIGRTPLYKPETVQAYFARPLGKAGRKKSPPPRQGYYSIDTLAQALGVSAGTIRYYLKAGALEADYVPTKGKNAGRKFFNEDTLASMRKGEHILEPRKVHSGETGDETASLDDTKDVIDETFQE